MGDFGEYAHVANDVKPTKEELDAAWPGRTSAEATASPSFIWNTGVKKEEPPEDGAYMPPEPPQPPVPVAHQNRTRTAAPTILRRGGTQMRTTLPQSERPPIDGCDGGRVILPHWSTEIKQPHGMPRSEPKATHNRHRLHQTASPAITAFIARKAVRVQDIMRQLRQEQEERALAEMEEEEEEPEPAGRSTVSVVNMTRIPVMGGSRGECRCVICGKVTSTRKGLMFHMSTHTVHDVLLADARQRDLRSCRYCNNHMLCETNEDYEQHTHKCEELMKEKSRILAICTAMLSAPMGSTPDSNTRELIKMGRNIIHSEMAGGTMKLYCRYCRSYCTHSADMFWEHFRMCAARTGNLWNTEKDTGITFLNQRRTSMWHTSMALKDVQPTPTEVRSPPTAPTSSSSSSRRKQSLVPKEKPKTKNGLSSDRPSNPDKTRQKRTNRRVYATPRSLLVLKRRETPATKDSSAPTPPASKVKPSTSDVVTNCPEKEAPEEDLDASVSDSPDAGVERLEGSEDNSNPLKKKYIVLKSWPSSVNQIFGAVTCRSGPVWLQNVQKAEMQQAIARVPEFLAKIRKYPSLYVRALSHKTKDRASIEHNMKLFARIERQMGMPYRNGKYAKLLWRRCLCRYVRARREKAQRQMAPVPSENPPPPPFAFYDIMDEYFFAERSAKKTGNHKRISNEETTMSEVKLEENDVEPKAKEPRIDEAEWTGEDGGEDLENDEESPASVDEMMRCGWAVPASTSKAAEAIEIPAGLFSGIRPATNENAEVKKEPEEGDVKPDKEALDQAMNM